MNKRKRQSRLLSLGLCLCMLVSTLPLTGMTYAAETPCPNHQSHTTECGYAKAVEGAPCKHIEAGQHNENCGYSAGIPEVPCNMGCTETGEGGQIIHASDCAYATAVPGTPCKHIEAGQHDENCGYSKAVEGAPCAHTCEKCDGSAESTPKTCVLTEGCTLPAGHDGKCALAMALGGSASTNVIAGDGYRFYPDTGELYAINAAGTTGWRTDTRIHAEETQRYKVVKSVGFQVNAIAIGPEAFRYCSDLTSAILPGSVMSIDEFAFAESGLATISLPYQLQSIGKSAFSSSHLTEITFPASVTYIGESAFDSCQSLGTITFLGGSPPKIEKNAFKDAADTGAIYYPAGASANYTEAWKNSAGLSGWTLEEQAAPAITTLRVDFSNNGSGGTSFTDNEMKDAIDTALAALGADKTKIDTIQIIGSVTEITQWNWRHLRELYHINSDWSNLYRLDLSGITGLKALSNTTGQTYGNITKLTALILPDSLENIGDSAFNGCTDLALTALPHKVNTIGKHAFAMCKSLALTELPKEVTTIGDYAFNGCTSLIDLKIPNKVKNIGTYSFGYCTNLVRIVLPNELTTIGNYAFTNCANLTELTFTGDTIPTTINTSAFRSLPAGGTIRFPAGATSYTEDWKDNTLRLSDWTLAPAYRLTVENGTDTTGGVIYSESEQAQITANAAPQGKVFEKWVSSDGGSFANANNPSTSFTMPGNAVTVTANFKDAPPVHTHTYGDWQYDKDNHWKECTAGDSIIDKAAHIAVGWITDMEATESEAGSRHKECTVCKYVMETETIAPTGPTYEYRTLRDADTGIKVSGYFTSDAALVVKDRRLHVKGSCEVCDDIRAREDKGELIALFDIGLFSGKYTGDLTVEIPVDAKYNGQTVLFLHCKDKVLENRTLTVENDIAKGTFSGLSPFAVAEVPGKTIITGLPDAYTLLVGQSISWMPAPAGGTWSYDKDYLQMTQDGGTYTFKALKAGKATATYTVDGVPYTVHITINTDTIPQTGDTANPLFYLLLMLAALLGCGGLLAYRKFGYKKRHG